MKKAEQIALGMSDLFIRFQNIQSGCVVFTVSITVFCGYWVLIEQRDDENAEEKWV